MAQSDWNVISTSYTVSSDNPSPVSGGQHLFVNGNGNTELNTNEKQDPKKNQIMSGYFRYESATAATSAISFRFRSNAARTHYYTIEFVLNTSAVRSTLRRVDSSGTTTLWNFLSTSLGFNPMSGNGWLYIEARIFENAPGQARIESRFGDALGVPTGFITGHSFIDTIPNPAELDIAGDWTIKLIGSPTQDFRVDDVVIGEVTVP